MCIANCRVVLVRPRVAGNLGATARVMRNFGLSDLVLVAPESHPGQRQARRLSTHGEGILRQARIVDNLADAVADCVVVAATSARRGKLIRGQAGPPASIIPLLTESARVAPVALVFGPERTGLSNDDISRCHHLIHIDAEDDYPALNLAQAVAICLYELRKGARNSGRVLDSVPNASFADQDRMFDRLHAALESIHFLYGAKAETLNHALRHLLGRARLTKQDVRILTGLARQIEWYVREHGA